MKGDWSERGANFTLEFVLKPEMHRRVCGFAAFGGFNMSGTDSKAGGPDYLLLFTQAKSIAERI